MVKLLLFDIDGTLLHSGGAGRRSMVKAFEEVYNVRDGFDNVPMSGRTDPVILKHALDLRGLVWRREEVERFKGRYFQLLGEEITVPTQRQRLMPGVQSLLEKLSHRAELVLGLLTGNWHQGAMIKLRHFGLDSYFEIGAFADDTSVREQLLPFALQRAREKLNTPIRAADTYVIGDTPMDIHCARPYGARTIAVATGEYSLDELAREKPDYLFDDFQDRDAFLKIFA